MVGIPIMAKHMMICVMEEYFRGGGSFAVPCGATGLIMARNNKRGEKLQREREKKKSKNEELGSTYFWAPLKKAARDGVSLVLRRDSVQWIPG